MSKPWRGVFTIPVTPFDANGEIDLVSFRRCVEFCVLAGAHGIVAPVNASEAPVMTELFGLAGPRLKGVMGGMAGRFMLDEFRRGASGTMPACEVTDVHVQIWEALEAGDEAAARALHTRLLPLLNIEAPYGSALYKEVLRRRRTIACARVRGPGAVALDSFDQYELDRILAGIESLLRV